MARQSSQRCKCRPKNYIGISDFEKALDVPVKFDIELPYDEQVELSENTGVPIINEYHKESSYLVAIIKSVYGTG